MAQVVLYTKHDCVYCDEAKRVLRNAGIHFYEKVLDEDFTREHLKKEFPHATTYPVVVYEGYFIGGTQELKEQINSDLDTRKLLNE